MAKKSVKIEDVEFNAQKVGIEKDKTEALVNDLRAMLEEESADKEPANPKQFVVLVSDPEGKITDDHVAWVLQIEEDESPATTVEKLSLVAAQYNGSKKGSKTPSTSIGETIEAVPAKFFRENNIWKKTAEPVLVIKTDNQLMDLTNIEQ